MQTLDLTKTLNKDTFIYTDGDYTDPLLEIDTWCTINQQGYHVSRLAMGTQTGTHIDAPAHFQEGGDTLEALPVEALIGPYFWIDLDRSSMLDDLGYQNQSILFLTTTSQTHIEMPKRQFKKLLALPCLVWLIAYPVSIAGQDALYFHRALAEAGKYLIEDVDESVASLVEPNGKLIALPLRLAGVSGSPCRVIVHQRVEA
ncbi:MAG: cyclase family protein [Chloroflexota bacterium]